MQIFLAKENDYVYSKNIIFLFICISKRFPDERAKLTVSLTEILPLIGRGVIIHEMPTIFFLQFFYSYLKSYSNTWVLLLVIFPTRKRNKNFKKKWRKTNIIILSDRTQFTGFLCLIRSLSTIIIAGNQ